MPGDINGKVTTREFYQELQEMRKENMNARMDTNQKVGEIETNLMKHITQELKPLITVCNQVDTNKEEIDNLRSRSNIFDGIIGFFTAIGIAIAALMKAN